MEFLMKALELQKSLSAAAHLIHGSSEGRFTITYCPGGLTREEVEGGEAIGRDCLFIYGGLCGIIIASAVRRHRHRLWQMHDARA